MKFDLPKIYPLTDISIARLSHLEQVKQLIDGGATMIQLREKKLSPKEFFAVANEVLNFARPRNIKIIINDRVDIAFAVKADGVHLGQEDLPPDRARKILGDAVIIGFSTHTLAQAVEAAKLPIDYVAIGPIFKTTSKKNPDAVVGLENLRKVREAIDDFPLVAIGGINFENAESVLQNGANSLATIGTVLNQPNKISENFLRLNK